MTPDCHIEPIVLSVPDLTEALDYFTRRLNFRLDMILPADAPRVALVSGPGLTLRLEATALTASEVEPSDTFLISRCDEAWHEGRAGMQYRDLIPGRLGGRVVASHIRIPDGGAVADYVHYHKIRFQMIYCQAGWVRVVYEDQGPPFVLEAGDCVLQPPEIRHRVLEASPGLEVIEVGCPALHETWVEHELQLPTAQLLPERIFNGQRFVRHRANEAQWTPWRSFEARDIGIAAATNGLAGARVVRATNATTALIDRHAGELLFRFVLQGELDLADEHRLHAGDSCVIPAGLAYSLRASAGLEWLEVALPAE
jgi:quercetin dioxygenase-like cupin family protein